MANSIESLRDDLFNVFHQLKTGGIEHAIAKEMNNAAGKIINTARVQLEYYALRKETPSISFLASNDESLVSIAPTEKLAVVGPKSNS